MMTHDHLATIRAALLFWQEEMCPHDTGIGRPYFDTPLDQPLSASDVARLRAELLDTIIRYALLDRDRNKLVSSKLYSSVDGVPQRADSNNALATVLLPGER